MNPNIFHQKTITSPTPAHLGAELGAAIRKLVTRIHRMAPALAGHDVGTIEKRLQEEALSFASLVRHKVIVNWRK